MSCTYYRWFRVLVYHVWQIPAPYTLNSVRWAKLYSNLTISDQRQVSWEHYDAVHEVLKSQLNWVQLLRINQDIPGPDQTCKYCKYFPFLISLSVPLSCLCVCTCRNILVSVWQTEWSRGEQMRNGCVSIWGLMIDGQLWLPWEYVVAGKNPWCLVHLQSWHRFHFTAVHNSHAIALLHQQ